MNIRIQLRRWFSYSLILSLLACSSGPYLAEVPITLELTTQPTQQANLAWPVVENLPAPNGLRPCCPFAYDFKVQLVGIPVPFYRRGNIVEADSLGKHNYNEGFFNSAGNLFGFSSENSGLLYTTQGGFIDIAHVRDSADMTFYLFSRIWPQLGNEQNIQLDPELTQRQIKLFAFSLPPDKAERYTVATYLAGYLAYQVAVWHEIAQWYGYRSVVGFSEEISAFSPEDLYSNLLGVRLAISSILDGNASSQERFNESMRVILPIALQQIGALSADCTRSYFDRLDGKWWDSSKAVPEKYLLLKRDYNTANDRYPILIPDEKIEGLRLQIPTQVAGLRLENLGELQLWPGSSMKNLPVPPTYYTFRDFPILALYAEEQDALELKSR